MTPLLRILIWLTFLMVAFIFMNQVVFFVSALMEAV